MNLDIRHERKGQVDYVILQGEIDTYTAPELREVLMPLSEKSNNQIVVDLSDVQYIDSTGLGIFVGALKASDTSGSRLQMTGVVGRVKRLFNITGLDRIVDIVAETREEAK